MWGSRVVGCPSSSVDSVPSIELSYSTDSSAREVRRRCFEEKKDSVLKTTPQSNVHWCKSKMCQACKTADPMFVVAKKVDAAKIRRLPKRWWDHEDSSSFLHAVTGLFCSMVPPEDGDDIDDYTAVTWLTGTVDSYGEWQPTRTLADDRSAYLEQHRLLQEYRISLVDDFSSVPYDDDSSVPYDERF